MSGLPVVRPRQPIRAPKRAGFVVHHIRGNHYYLRHPDRPGMLITVPFHNRDLKRRTLHAILRQAELRFDDLRRRL